MSVFNQLCALLLGTHLLASVPCAKGCTLEEFRRSNMFDKHFDFSNLEQSYGLGKSVRVPCQVGYRGFFRLICGDIGWVSRGDVCKKILCGHPGDVQFADFQLVKGTDYDFGSQVQYTCHRGYQMVSFTSTRNCLERGWDGHLPECEAVPCPSVKVNDNVLVSGDMDQATAGSVLQFSCSSRNEVIDGATQIICNEYGEWDKDPPTCKEISCPIPPLNNFEVEGEKTVYKKGEYLTYSCNHGYRKMDGRPVQCSKVAQSSQWTPMPRCELITCKVSSTPIEGTIYNPQKQIIFKVGEKVTVSCGETHYVKSPEHQTAELTCQDTGEWDYQPLCQPVMCSKYDQRVMHLRSFETSMFNMVKLNETLRYWCRVNYVETSSLATCTRRGWEPKPLCEEILCATPVSETFTVRGEKTEYKNNQVLTYTCNYGYRKVDTRQPQCQKVKHSSQWVPQPFCEAITCKLSSTPPQETTYTPQGQTTFSPGQKVTVSCGEKHWVKNKDLQTAELTCQDTGDWDFTPVCNLVTCLKGAEHVEFWDSTWSTLSMNESVRYNCDSDHVETSAKATCTRADWEPTPLCKEISCLVPQLEDFTVEGDKTEYKKDEFLTYTCNQGYSKVDKSSPRCQKVNRLSQWTPAPRCEPAACKLSSDPPQETTYSSQGQTTFSPGQTVTVSCGEKHWVKSTELQTAELTCQDTGDWDFTPVCKLVSCSKHDTNFTEWRRSGPDTVNIDGTWRYRCEADYEKTSPTATCTRQGWEPQSLCEEISCSKPQSENFVVDEEKTKYKSNEVLRYSCNRGYRKVDGRLSRCKKVGSSFQWSPMPRCEPSDEDTTTCKLSSDLPEETTYNPNQSVFRPGQKVTVSCGEKHWVKSTELQSAELTCQDNGDWDFEPVCQPVTCSKDDPKHIYDWQDSSSNTVNMDVTLWYQCQQNYVQTSATATCTRQGWEPKSFCEAKTCTLSPGPSHENTYNPRNQIIFKPNETLSVYCKSRYWVKNKELQSAQATCQDTGKWDFEPVCKKVTCSKDDAQDIVWGHSSSDTVNMDTELWYKCQGKYPYVRCTRRGWQPKPACEVSSQ